ncbi:ATP-binding protein [Prosthecomicrobium pneumaticum]|uniref:histidine kinase n=1 Tax=Prosthecomicrobium pneumaticum TaxID=81895 RepID=A0A7W9FPE7_9HYPH|nr:ATP-binding protein [Prosthecomicrobium pneumaticum]MBB5754465.1 signal transduction histidine kinase [Prosthecomicrobium pneumaticum]
MAAESPKRPRRVSARLLLLALVGVLVGPGLVFTALLISRYAASERTRYEAQARSLAEQVKNAVNSDLAGLRSTLQTLGTSTRLAAGDVSGFYDQMVTVKSFLGADIALRAIDGQQLANTRLPGAHDLPKTPLDVDAAAIATRRPVISGVYVGAIAQRPVIAIALAWPEVGTPRYLLHVNFSTDRIAEIIRRDLPPGWIISVVDRSGVVVARSERHAEISGQPGLPEFIAKLDGPGGTFTNVNRFGEELLVGYTRSTSSGWSVTASIPEALVRAPLLRDLALLIGFGALAFAISGGLAYWLFGLIARPLAALTRASRNLGSEDARFDVDTPIREIARLGDALGSASDELARSIDRARRSDEALQRANERLEQRVRERTRELTAANEALRTEALAREAAELQLRQAQKMEALGQLTGGIAHDFNNMLAVVIGGLNLMRARLERGDTDVGRFLDAAMEGGRRAAELTARLLAFARQQPLAPEPTDGNRLIGGMADLLNRTLREDVRLETVLAAGLWRIHVDPGQLENALLNLAVNARDAMPEGGRLTIETGNGFIDEAYALEHGLSAGQYVMIAVSDTGTGMPPEVAARAFDPFFTTKDVGKGTGLGLSQVYGFVRQSNGHVKIYSEPGEGTTVKIYLPRWYGAEERPGRAATAADVARAADGETVLVVEDEERVRMMTCEALRELGYRVLEADGAAGALALLDAGDTVTLLFTDIVMPEVNGRRLAEEALRRRPGLKVLFTTGFTRNAVVHNGVLDPGVNFLQKPFTLDQLAARVRATLDG